MSCNFVQHTIIDHTTHVKTHKLLQVCKQVIRNLFTSCRQVVFALLVPSCCNKFGTSCYQHVTSLMTLLDLLQVVITSLIWSYNKNVTRLMTQGYNNIVISWLYLSCWNNLATRLITSTRLLQVLNSLFQTCWRLVTRCEIFARQCNNHHYYQDYCVIYWR
jgi:hypothetical protein